MKERHSSIIPAVLFICIVVVAIWEFMASRSGRPYGNNAVSAVDFKDFRPSPPAGWSIERSNIVADDPSAPNLFAFMLRDSGRRDGFPVLVRLVQGYNMPDCMRLKKYAVEKIMDGSNTAGRVQAWRLTSDIGERSVWTTAMLRMPDFAGTGEEVSNMKFPRVGFAEVAGWDSGGISLSWLRHPLRNTANFMKAKWNDSRCDLAVFLRLKQPPWTSEEYLTFVASSRNINVKPGEEAAAVARVIAVQSMFHSELVKWHSEKTGESR